VGGDPREIEAIARDLTPYVGYAGSGVETRGRSAIDVALWDLLGKATEQPLYVLLGGLSRPSIRTYNTCAGPRYVRSRPDWSTDDWGLGTEAEGPYEDLDAFLHRADELALSLLDEGITGMKIWPFDFAAEASAGYDISAAELDRALEPLRKIRAAVGDRIDVMVELHALWHFPAALKIAAALEEFDPFWYEDPVRADDTQALAAFAAATPVPVCAGETVAGLRGFRELLEAEAAAILMPDVGWCGGLTEARKIAALAEAHHRAVAPHDCTGPVLLMASVHLSLSAPNALVQETVRAFYAGWYRELVTVLPVIEQGHILPPEGPGLGTELLPEVLTRPDATVRTTGAD
jgi:L-alanine-DL-glutamate epimerase-like enolase superfamily enzyme